MRHYNLERKKVKDEGSDDVGVHLAARRRSCGYSGEPYARRCSASGPAAMLLFYTLQA
ncbi:MAG: hypothetical protein AABZ10_12520 [Nitrospirota bacterium]